MKIFTVLIAVTALGMVACPAAAIENTEPMTSEYMLKKLVQIAMQEDLVDEKRVGDLLKLDIVMIPESAFLMKDGRMEGGATSELPKDPGYLSGGRSYFYYRHITSPIRRAILSMNIDSRKLCINYKDVLAEFGKHGEVRPNAPPVESSVPVGTPSKPTQSKAQPFYSYSFKNERSEVVLTFAYAECLTRFYIHQPANDK